MKRCQENRPLVIPKENIPAATQLFTPDWIVKYMVENSLGRVFSGQRAVASGQNLTETLRVEAEKKFAEQFGWKYYIPEAEQSDEVRKLTTDHSLLTTDFNIEDIKVIDPCMGSGHILVYAFDVLYQIYQSQGYAERDIPNLILENNIYGLDLDARAGQLAYFALMMKARSYNRRFFRQENVPQPQVFSPMMDGELLEYGSLMKIDSLDSMPMPTTEIHEIGTPQYFETMHYHKRLNDWKFKRLLTQKYDAVVTNPPYMGSSGMGGKLAEYVKKNYPDSKSDLFAVFIEKCGEMLKPNGYQAMITQHAWMFLSSYEKLRKKLMQKDIINMAHLGARAFDEIGGEVVQTTAFVMQNSHVTNYKATYVRLVDYNSQQAKEEAFLSGKQRHTATADNFAKIPGSPVAYWVSENLLSLLSTNETIGKNYSVGSGLSTSDNLRFLRYIWEVDNTTIAHSKNDKTCKWFLFQKGGEYRKWYGNLEYVVNWADDGAEIKYWVTHNPADPNTTHWSRRIFNTDLYFLEGISWSVIGSGDISFRLIEQNSMISNAAGGIFKAKSKTELLSLLSAVNSKVWTTIFSLLNPTMNYSSGIIQKAPLPKTISSELADINITLSRTDWDSFETSWDFKRHPLVSG